MPPRVSFASNEAQQSPEQIADLIQIFLTTNVDAVLLEDGKVLFTFSDAQYSLNTDHRHCTLHVWGSEGNTVRRIVSASARSSSLRLGTLRLGESRPKTLDLLPSRGTQSPTARDTTRRRYMRLLERALMLQFPGWKPQNFRTTTDLQRSFGPAYARGSVVRGNQAWAVIGVSQHENQSVVDGILTAGILWLHHCREGAGGKRLYQGLKVIVPRGMAMLSQSRMAWMNADAAQWELFELEEETEDLTPCDADDTGNLRTRLVHRPEEHTAKERFANAVDRVMELTPQCERHRVEQRLRSATELAFLLHGFEFARAHVVLSNGSFRSKVRITVGAAENETELTEDSRHALQAFVADLFSRRRAFAQRPDYTRRGFSPARRIGLSTATAAHARLRAGEAAPAEAVANAQQDPLYRAAPERWLESMLRQDLAPLTRGLAPPAFTPDCPKRASAVDANGNRADRLEETAVPGITDFSRIIPRLDPAHVYTQVPAIAGASDRGMLDLLGVTTDGRLAVIELKADDDLHLPLQGLDYWIRVRHHHLQNVDPVTALGEFQRHGYFKDVELSPSPPRLYLVAPALHIHPATETILRYLSPRVEWTLLALDERWRQEIRVVWRKTGGGSSDLANKQ